VIFSDHAVPGAGAGKPLRGAGLMTIVFDKRHDRLYRQPNVNENRFHPVGARAQSSGSADSQKTTRQ
jgi:hypothetical protein